MTVCANPDCSNDLAPSKGGPPRKWCSDKCRKAATYVRHCLDCGAKLNGSDGNGPNAPARCVKCASVLNGAARVNHDQRAEVARLWAEGKSQREIAAAVGWEPTTVHVLIHRYRAEGVDLPRRYEPRPEWAPEDILEALRLDAAKRGRAPTVAEWNAPSQHPAASTVVRHFGRWNVAVAAAGLTPRPQGRQLARAA